MNRPPAEVACLCAAWCHLCTAYRPVFEAVVAETAAGGVALRGHWIDIENEPDLVGNFDVETFPTLVIVGADGRLVFAGPLPPQPATLRRLLRATTTGDSTAGGGFDGPDEAHRFAARLVASMPAPD